MTVVDQLLGAFMQITPAGMNPIFFWGSFLLTYAISFSVLLQISLFSENKAVVTVISFVIALMVALSPAVSEVLSASVPGVGLIVIFLVCVLLAVNLLYPGETLFGGHKTWMIVGLFIITGLLFSSTWLGEQVKAGKDYVEIGGFRLTGADAEVLVALVAVGVFMFLVSRAVKGGKGG